MVRPTVRTGKAALGAGGRLALRPLAWSFTGFCSAVVRVFYRRCEVHGLEHIPAKGAVVLCANHPNALVDAVILQAVSPRGLHPLARAGLFRNPLLIPILTAIGAVPVQRRQDAGAGQAADDASRQARNVDAFSRCYEWLAKGHALLIFPEGESHSGSSMRGFRTGAARIVLGALEANGVAPTVLAAGLSFSQVGRFRGSVFINISPAIPVRAAPISAAPISAVRTHTRPEEAPEESVRRLTADIPSALESVTLNPETWKDLDLLRQIERFFAMRRGLYRKRNLEERFRSLKYLIAAHQRLRAEFPERVERVQRRLSRFENLCRRAGVRDYHLTVDYTPRLVGRFVVRALAALLLAVPLGAWGALNSWLPYRLTGFLARRMTRGRYQYETAQISFSLFLFSLFWGGQIAAVQAWLGGGAAALYALSLPFGAAAALMVRRERDRIIENVRVFFIFLNRKDLRAHLEKKRRELERELARLAQLAKVDPAAINPEQENPGGSATE